MIDGERNALSLRMLMANKSEVVENNHALIN